MMEKTNDSGCVNHPCESPMPSGASSNDFTPPMPGLAHDGVSGLGVLMQLRRNALAAFPARCFTEPLVRLRVPGRALFLVSGSACIAEALQVRADAFSRVPAGRRVLGPIVGKGLLTSEGATWRQQRLAMAPAFTPRQLPMMCDHIIRATDDTGRELRRDAGHPIDLYRSMQLLSLEIAARSMFSVEATSFRDRLRCLVTDYMRGIGRPSPEDFILPEWLPTPLAIRRRLFRRRWLTLIRAVVAGRRQTGNGASRDLFDVLAALHSDEPDILVDQVATMIVAGHETTALTLFWALFLLAHAPEWQETIRAEVSNANLSPDNASAALPSLSVTRAVVNETLRLYSPAFMTARIAVADTQIGGEPVAKGSMVFMPFWMLHRNPALWSDPARFDPARFLGAQPGRDQFLPFGLGPHVCIGAQLAMTEAVLALAVLLRDFHVALIDPGRPVLPVATLSTRPDHAPAFQLTPVKSSPFAAAPS